jgi:transmembrane sensor
MGWVKGKFVFKDLNIKEVMKIAGRWYDIEVEYRGNVQSKKFGGTTSRFSNITELLDYMKITGGVNYKIEGRRVILMN